MRRGWQIASAGFLALSLLVVAESLRFPLTDPLGPGPGFFPFWLSLLSGGLAVVLFVQVSRAKPDAEGAGLIPDRAGLIPDRAAATRVLLILGGLGAVTLLLARLGFRLTLLLFIVYLLVALGVRRWWLVAVLAVLGSFGVFHVFYYWLKVPLPIGTLGL